MSVTAFLLSAAVATTAPAAGSTAPNDRAATPCSPSPYYIADREEQPAPERLVDRPRSTQVGVVEKRTRPCYLTRNQDEPTSNPRRRS